MKKRQIFYLIFLFSIQPLRAQKISYVTDFGNENHLEKFEFAAIRDIAVVSNDVFILDNILFEIRHLTFSGNEFIRRENISISRGRGPGEFLDPSALAVSRNLIVLADSRNQKIAIFNHDGELKNEFVIRYMPVKIYVNEDADRLLISGFWPTFQGELVHVYDLEGNFLNTFAERPENWLQIAQTGNFERLLPFEDSVFISYPQPYKIEKYNWSGELLNSYTDISLRSEIEDEGAFRTINARITDLNVHRDQILALVHLGDSYQLDLFDQELNKVTTIPGEVFELDHLSFLRVLDDSFILLRQLDLVPHLLVYSISWDSE